jgi:hypothetical protein
MFACEMPLRGAELKDSETNKRNVICFCLFVCLFGANHVCGATTSHGASQAGTLHLFLANVDGAYAWLNGRRGE